MKLISDIRETLIDLGYSIVQESDDYFRMKPLYRESKTETALSVNKTTGQFYDFATQQKGSLKQLIKLTTGESVDVQIDQVATVQKEKIDQVFSESILETLFPSYSYFNKRGISSETLKEFKGGLATNGKMYGRFVFPIFRPDGKINGFTGRDVTNNSKRVKWKHLGRTNRWVYPLFFNRKYIEKDLIIVESIGDMLSLWEAGVRNTLVIFGSYLNKEPLKTILGLGLNRVIISTNNDENNAGQESAKKIAEKLNPWFPKENVLIKLPTNKNDFGEMNLHEIREWKNTF